ncbi:unnamed protein product [Pocillopora meandrina]|uniref:Iodothyronine deiodinase n=1 Tax=Pocillopora meandrina TaxID=46732 RepID=A0AAU9VKP3_9CNID|nr:unnamed protein product [Pocillopora meandrina]
MYFELQVFQRFLIYSSLILLFTVGRMLKILPFFKSMISIAMCKMTDTSLPTEIYWDSLFTWKMLQNVYYCLLADMGKKVKLNNKAYNSPIVSIDGQRCQRILDFAKGSRPLVLNFGSSTCPVFMQMLKRYQLLMKEFQEMADFAVIYIEEAHPVDGWAFKDNSDIPKHRTLDERCKAAQKMAKSLDLCSCTVAVDSMLNAANIAYGAVPIRLYIVQSNKIAYEGGAGPMNYRMQEVKEWLQRFRARQSV